MQISTISILNFSECVSVLDMELKDRSDSVLILLSVMKKVEELTGKVKAGNWGIGSLCGSVSAYPVGRDVCLVQVDNFSITLDEQQLGFGASLIVFRELYNLTGAARYEQLLIALYSYLSRDDGYNDGALTLFKLSLK